MPQAALRPQLVDQPLEGDVLVRVGAEGRFTHPAEQLPEAGVAGQVDAQGQSVDEEPDEVLDLVPAIGDRRADHHVVLPGEALEQGREGGQERHEQGDLAALAETGEPRREVGRERERQGLAAVAAHLGPRPVGGQIEHRGGAGEPPLPVPELPVQHLAGQPPSLPDGEVGVLQRQLKEGRWPAGREGRIEGRELPDQNGGGPAVRDDVMQGQENRVVLLAEPQQPGAQQRAALEVEGEAGLLPRQPVGLGLAPRRGKGREVGQREGQLPLGGDDLDGGAVMDREGGAQHLVSADDLAEAACQRGGVEPPGEAQGGGDVVSRAARLELVQEPEPLLGEGEREGLGRGARQPGDRLARGRRVLAPQPPQQELALLGREVRDPLEEISHRTPRRPARAPDRRR